MSFFGFFKEIQEKNIRNTKTLDFYQGYFSTVYDKLCSESEYDVETYLRQAAVAGGPILELACGSGRITLKLAKAGYEVVGVDLSKDMLNLLEKNLTTIPRRLRSNVEFYEKNMLKLDFDRKFNLVILPATTICLISDEEIHTLFEEVYKVLAPGGRFVFDYYSYQFNTENVEKMNELTTFLFEDPRSKQQEFVFLQEKLSYKLRKCIVNFYVEVIDEKGGTERLLSYSEKRMRDDEQIEEAIRKTKFKKIICEAFPSSLPLTSVEEEKIKYCVLEKSI